MTLGEQFAAELSKVALDNDDHSMHGASANDGRLTRGTPVNGGRSIRGTLAKGQHVVLVDAPMEGVIVSLGKKVVIETADGLQMEVGYNEVAAADPDEESQLLSRVPGAKKREKTAGQAARRSIYCGTVTVDLHIEAIPGGRSVPPESRLAFQLQYFRRVIRENMKHCGMKMNIVHGVGDGILRDAVRRDLEDIFALHCTYIPGPPGVTVVTFR